MKKIDLVILAAGKSSRFGSLKGFAIHNGAPLLESAITLHQNNFLGKTIVVYSDDSYEYKERLSSQFSAAHFEHNSTPEFGPFSSLQVGLKKTSADYIMILPVDCPCRNVKTWLTLTENLSENKLVWKPSYDNRGGHPIVIHQDFRDISLQASSDSILSSLIRALPLELIDYVVVPDASILKNINTREDID